MNCSWQARPVLSPCHPFSQSTFYSSPFNCNYVKAFVFSYTAYYGCYTVLKMKNSTRNVYTVEKIQVKFTHNLREAILCYCKLTLSVVSECTGHIDTCIVHTVVDKKVNLGMKWHWLVKNQACGLIHCQVMLAWRHQYKLVSIEFHNA